MTEVAECPRCGESIDDTWQRPYCGKCFEYFPKDVKSRLPNRETRYPALSFIIGIYQITAILVLLGGIAAAVVTSDVGMPLRIGVLVVAGLICLFQWAAAEVIQVFIDIEANTRSKGG